MSVSFNFTEKQKKDQIKDKDTIPIKFAFQTEDEVIVIHFTCSSLSSDFVRIREEFIRRISNSKY